MKNSTGFLSGSPDLPARWQATRGSRPTPEMLQEVKRDLARIIEVHAGSEATYETFTDYFVLLWEDIAGAKVSTPSDALIREVWVIYREVKNSAASANGDQIGRTWLPHSIPPELKRDLAEMVALHVAEKVSFESFCDLFRQSCKEIAGSTPFMPSETLLREVWENYRKMMGDNVSAARTRLTLEYKHDRPGVAGKTSAG
jgi:hypothetical protein